MAYTQFQFRRDTAANWVSNNPILAEGEMGVETDGNRFKIGDGVNTWNSLTYPWYDVVSTVTYNDGGTSTIDANSGGNVVFSLTSNGSSTTIAMANIPTTGTRYAFELHLTWTSGAITFPASWSRGENPPSTTGNYLITGITIDGGTSFTLTVVYQ